MCVCVCSCVCVCVCVQDYVGGDEGDSIVKWYATKHSNTNTVKENVPYCLVL
jgi:hypothetical protein